MSVKAEIGPIASPGWRLIAGDWSAMELRAAAQISGDAALSALFERGEDPHRLMAAALNGIEPSAVTPAQRQAAKPVNFGAIYGMGAQGLQQYAWDDYDLVLTKSEAQRQLDTFERQFRQPQVGVAGMPSFVGAGDLLPDMQTPRHGGGVCFQMVT